MKKEYVFFAIIALSIYLSMKLHEDNNEIKCIAISLLGGILLYILYVQGKVCPNSEGFWDVSKYSQCKGGPYMYQGDSPEAKMCREFASTPEGRCGIASYNCKTGYIGTPALPFQYTPLSNDNWESERCSNGTCAEPKGCDSLSADSFGKMVK